MASQVESGSKLAPDRSPVPKDLLSRIHELFPKENQSATRSLVLPATPYSGCTSLLLNNMEETRGECPGSSQLLLSPCRLAILCIIPVKPTVCQGEGKVKGDIGPGLYRPQLFPMPDVSWKKERNGILGWSGVRCQTLHVNNLSFGLCNNGSNRRGRE